MKYRLRRHSVIIAVLFALIISLGSAAYRFVEGWSILDSIYFVVVTVTTIGYGDLAPLTMGGKILTIFFSFFGIAMAFYVISVISGSLFKKHMGRKVGEIKKDIKKEEELQDKTKKKKSKKKR